MVRRLFESEQFFLSIIVEKDLFSLDIHHHIGCIDKLFQIFFGRLDGEVFYGWSLD